jgi:hypothetical protein
LTRSRTKSSSPSMLTRSPHRAEHRRDLAVIQRSSQAHRSSIPVHRPCRRRCAANPRWAYPLPFCLDHRIEIQKPRSNHLNEVVRSNMERPINIRSNGLKRRSSRTGKRL